MPVDNEQLKQMDEAGEKALAELEENFDRWSAKDVVTWWSRWYLKAGHKRLGRGLVGLSKNLPKKADGAG